MTPKWLLRTSEQVTAFWPRQVTDHGSDKAEPRRLHRLTSQTRLLEAREIGSADRPTDPGAGSAVRTFSL